VPDVEQTQPGRHQNIDWFADQLLARIAEQLFCLGVHHCDYSGVIDHEHAVRAGLDCQSEQLIVC
jgi:hypothetical protein